MEWHCGLLPSLSFLFALFRFAPNPARMVGLIFNERLGLMSAVKDPNPDRSAGAELPSYFGSGDERQQRRESAHAEPQESGQGTED